MDCVYLCIRLENVKAVSESLTMVYILAKLFNDVIARLVTRKDVVTWGSYHRESNSYLEDTASTISRVIHQCSQIGPLEDRL